MFRDLFAHANPIPDRWLPWKGEPKWNYHKFKKTTKPSKKKKRRR